MHMQSSSFWQRTHNRESKVSSINGAEKSGYPHENNDIRPLSYIIQKINWNLLKT